MSSSTGSPRSDGDTETTEHHVWATAVTNGPVRGGIAYGAEWYSQACLHCRCGWQRITIYELIATLAAQHYQRHGRTPQRVEYGMPAE